MKLRNQSCQLILGHYRDMERVYVSSQGQFIGERDYYKQINGQSYLGIPFDLLKVMFAL